MRSMACDVEVANAESEVDRIDVFESLRKKWRMRQEERERQRREGTAAHRTGVRRSASFRLPSRYP